MRYFGFIVFLFSQMALAWCPDENQRINLQGTLVQHTYPGAPNYESIADGDEALTYDYVKLEEPFDCEMTGEAESVAEVQLIFVSKSKVSYADIAPVLNKNVVATGKTMYAQTGRHFTPVLLVVDDVKPVTTSLTPEQKKSMLVQFTQFQQALRNNDVAAVKSFFLFPVSGDVYGFESDAQSAQLSKLTEAVFDRDALHIIARLHRLSEVVVDPETLAIKALRINALSEQEQKRHYFPGAEGGVFYYEENGQRHNVSGVCDDVAGGEFDDEILVFHQGTSANLTLPGLSETCDGASWYVFKLIDGKLRLVSAMTVG